MYISDSLKAKSIFLKFITNLLRNKSVTFQCVNNVHMNMFCSYLKIFNIILAFEVSINGQGTFVHMYVPNSSLSIKGLQFLDEWILFLLHGMSWCKNPSNKMNINKYILVGESLFEWKQSLRHYSYGTSHQSFASLTLGPLLVYTSLDKIYSAEVFRFFFFCPLLQFT